MLVRTIFQLYIMFIVFYSTASCKGPPPHVDSGLRIFEGLKHGDRAKYICRNGYQLTGITDQPPYLVCKFGTWSGGSPKCKECKSSLYQF